MIIYLKATGNILGMNLMEQGKSEIFKGLREHATPPTQNHMVARALMYPVEI